MNEIVKNSNLEKDFIPFQKIKNKFILERFTENDLLKLAESNACPHLVFKHPITGKIEILFDVLELIG